MTPDTLAGAARAEALSILGHCATVPEDGLGMGTIALLGPAEPGFWAHVNRAPEFRDGRADPLDRWSERVISALAEAHGGTALFPFGTPARPFIGWALRSGRAWQSPVGLLVHDEAGLLVSYRGAILFPAIDWPRADALNPCPSCREKPCLTACPVSAMTDRGYDIPGCKSYLDSPAGQSCRASGCAVRLACPISRSYPRDHAQSAFHMRAFHPTSAH